MQAIEQAFLELLALIWSEVSLNISLSLAERRTMINMYLHKTYLKCVSFSGLNYKKTTPCVSIDIMLHVFFCSKMEEQYRYTLA